MKIARIEVYQADLPYAGGVYHLSGGRSFEVFDATFVRMIADDGTEGWGESTPFGSTYIPAHGAGVRAGIAAIAPDIIGRDPRCFDRLYDCMDQALAGHAHAKTALDVAAWDLSGKALGLPVCDLLGGRIDGPVPVISSISAEEPDRMRANVAAHRALGFKAHSVKIGAPESEGGPALDAARIEASLADREASEWFLVDANGGLSVEHALRLEALLPKGLDFVLEAPCGSWAETRRLRDRYPRPLLIDELAQSDEDVALIIQERLADGVGLKISKQGGLTRARRQRDICAAAGLVVSVQDTVGSEISFAALLHLAQSTPRKFLRAALDTRSMVSRRIAAFDAPIRMGGAAAPSAPGLGVEVDIDALGEAVAKFGGAI